MAEQSNFCAERPKKTITILTGFFHAACVSAFKKTEHTKERRTRAGSLTKEDNKKTTEFAGRENFHILLVVFFFVLNFYRAQKNCFDKTSETVWHSTRAVHSLSWLDLRCRISVDQLHTLRHGVDLLAGGPALSQDTLRCLQNQQSAKNEDNIFYDYVNVRVWQRNRCRPERLATRTKCHCRSTKQDRHYCRACRKKVHPEKMLNDVLVALQDSLPNMNGYVWVWRPCKDCWYGNAQQNIELINRAVTVIRHFDKHLGIYTDAA